MLPPQSTGTSWTWIAVLLRTTPFPTDVAMVPVVPVEGDAVLLEAVLFESVP